MIATVTDLPRSFGDNPAAVEGVTLNVNAGEVLGLIELDARKRVGSLDALASCGALRILRALRCGVVPSLGFVRSLPVLEQLRLNGTTIEDGDMSPCIGVDAVHVNNKKHYSHTLKQILAAD